MARARLIEVAWPEFGLTAETPDWRAPLEVYRRRLSQLEEAMVREGLTHLAVYGDREHFANLAWLTGFDPRFEEALCFVRPGAKPLLLAGNECLGYLPASPPVAAGDIEVRRHTPFSLPDQPSQPGNLLDGLDLDAHCKVGVAGWKSYSQPSSIDAPSYLVDELRFAAGYENVTNAAHLFIDNTSGLRTTVDPHEVAFFEWTNGLASEGMRRVIHTIRQGALDYDLLEQARFNGVPLSAHMTLKCGANRVSLASARGERVTVGGRFSCGIAYWGANVCRCGWVAASERDLPPDAEGYLDHFAIPYFEAMAAWFDVLRIGATGGALHQAVHTRLDQDTFRVFLNAGHLIHLDEWLCSPVWAGSTIPLRSGMVMQSDVIPSNPKYYSSRMEDGYLMADAALQAQLEPALLDRCRARRDFMRTKLGLPVHDDVLPLSNLCGIVPPYLLAPHQVLSCAG
ncbi:M24 family metallopeptidase [Paludibaculum fermentans]|uniref:M24 family metallopeptidase n=1 Tax=Paludibaculum fermentans TaxID=1473598 RepID=A0A7S7NU84_PALFE|nr:M24 family metallopeptidase [Paludibaculum fermentans]QOY89339.1 M24 family metallopeptidase [Paludibaculum fermentans]